MYVKDDCADKLITVTEQRQETVGFSKSKVAKTGALLFETKARKWKVFHKEET